MKGGWGLKLVEGRRKGRESEREGKYRESDYLPLLDSVKKGGKREEN